MRTVKENRRSSFRVKVSSLQPVTIAFNVRGGPPGILTAFVNDISVGGAGATLQAPARLVLGQSVSHGVINLPETPGVLFEGIIRRQNRDQSGIEFRNMPEAAQRQILRYVFKREREVVACLKEFMEISTI